MGRNFPFYFFFSFPSSWLLGALPKALEDFVPKRIYESQQGQLKFELVSTLDPPLTSIPQCLPLSFYGDSLLLRDVASDENSSCWGRQSAWRCALPHGILPFCI